MSPDFPGTIVNESFVGLIESWYKHKEQSKPWTSSPRGRSVATIFIYIKVKSDSRSLIKLTTFD